jgi:hypothetical protein
MSALLRGFPLLLIAIYMAHVIQYLNTQELACVHEPFCDSAVFLAGLDVPAGMIMTTHNGRSIGEDSGLKRLSGMNHTGGQAPHRDRMHADHSIFLIHEKYDEVFSIRTG